MGIDSGYGVGSLKTGVCTSTTRPASPFEGQTVYETDTDLVKSYNGTSWAPVSGLQYITGASFSAVTSFSLAANTFSATYENYFITMIVTTGSLTSLRFRMRAAGVDNTSSNYRNSYLQDNAFATSTGDTGLIVNSYDTATSISASMYVHSPQLSVATQTTATGTYTRTTTPSSVLAGTTLTVTTSYDSMTFLRDAGTMTGSYKVYGLANS